MRVFISYRREDNPYLAEAIYTTLSNGYGDNNVFLDTASIHGGAEFERRIRQRVSMADAVVAVFGRQWQRSVPTSGRNWVVEELNLAREMGRLVVPVWEDLLDTMDYPEELGWLDQRNRVVIHAGRSQEDLAELPGLLTAAYRDHLSSSGLNDDAIQAALERAVRAEVASASPATRPLNREILLGIGLHGPNGYTPWLAGAVGELIDFCRDPQHSAAYRTLCEQAAVDEASIDIVWGDAAGGVIAVLAAAAVAADIGGERVEEQIIRLVDAGHLLGAPAATRDEVLFRAHDFFAPSLSACLESWLSATKRGRGACELVTVGTAQQICADPAGPSPCLAHVSLGPDDDADALAAKLVTAALVSTASRMIFGTMLAKQEDQPGCSISSRPPPASIARMKSGMSSTTAATGAQALTWPAGSPDDGRRNDRPIATSLSSTRSAPPPFGRATALPVCATAALPHLIRACWPAALMTRSRGNNIVAAASPSSMARHPTSSPNCSFSTPRSRRRRRSVGFNSVMPWRRR